MIRLFIVCVLLLFAPPPGHTADALPAPLSAAEYNTALTFEAALKLADSINPDLAVAQRQIDIAAGIKLQAQTRPNPDLSFTGDWLGQPQRESTLALSQEIELGGKRRARMNYAALGHEVATAAAAAESANVRANVRQTFFSALAAQEQTRLSAGSVALATRAANAAQRQIKAGRLTPVALSRAQIAVSNAELDLLEAETQLAAARQRLQAVCGETVATATLTGDLATLPALPELTALFEAIDRAPQLQQAQREIEKTEAGIGVEHSRRIGNLTLGGGARRLAQNGSNAAIVTLSIPLPIFDRNQGNLAAAFATRDQALDRERALRTRLQREIGEAYAQYRGRRLAVTAINGNILPAAQLALDATSKAFELGRFGIIDVLDAQKTLFTARVQYARALADAHAAYADIERALGGITASAAEIIDGESDEP